jgi:hypothetical protein
LVKTLSASLSRAGRHAWLAPIAAVTVVFWISIYIYILVSDPAEYWGVGVRESGGGRDEYESLIGLLWGGSALLFIAVTAAAAGVLGFTIYRSYKDYIGRLPSPGEILFAAVALLLPVCPALIPPFSRTPFVSMELVRAVLHTDVVAVVSFLWLLTMLAAYLVMGGAAACLLGTGHISRIHTGLLSARQDDQAGHVEQLATALQSQSRRLQAVLFAGAAVLVAGVIEVDALYSWAVSLADLTNYPDGAGKAVTATAVVPTATFFSLFLAAAYIPAALILRQRAATLAIIAVGTTAQADRSKWLQDNGLSISISTQVSSVVALLAPILAGTPLNALAQAFG